MSLRYIALSVYFLRKVLRNTPMTKPLIFLSEITKSFISLQVDLTQKTFLKPCL